MQLLYGTYFENSPFVPGNISEGRAQDVSVIKSKRGHSTHNWTSVQACMKTAMTPHIMLNLLNDICGVMCSSNPHFHHSHINLQKKNAH